MTDTHFHADAMDIAPRIQEHLTPLWLRLHESDRRFARNKAIPTILASHMCRHTSLFTKRLFDALGIEGWKAIQGYVHKSATSITPPDIHPDTTQFTHVWLMHRDGSWLDLSSEQFGLAPILMAHQKSPAFQGYVVERPAKLSSLRQTILNWEGSDEGSWHEWDLAPIRESYNRLLASAKTGEVA